MKTHLFAPKIVARWSALHSGAVPKAACKGTGYSNSNACPPTGGSGRLASINLAACWNVVLFGTLLLYSVAMYGQQVDTVGAKKVTFKTFVVPTTLMAAGLLTQGAISRSVRDELVKSYPTFHTSLDNSMQYAPLALLAGFDAIGLKAKHKVGDQVILALLSNAVAQTITQGLKYTVRYPRPDGEGNESFPSGHTTMAFTSATLLHNEFGQQSVVISILGYSAATATGAMRMLNNRHWLADVLFGAGVGIGSTQAVYALYPWIQRKIFKRTNVVALPTYSGSTGGFYLAVVF